jgi:SAM-dependent methyltransferase
MKSEGKILVRHYESCFQKHGDCAKGVDWPSEESAQTRYRVMSEFLLGSKVAKPTLLDYGCGLGHFYKYLQDSELANSVQYTGVDASPVFIETCKKKFKRGNFHLGDILDGSMKMKGKKFDFIILNGVLTERRELSQKTMQKLFEKVISELFPLCKEGLAFNTMSKIVDWEREDLFHLDFMTMANFISQNFSRNFTIRHDYGLYDYTVYLYREPQAF